MNHTDQLGSSSILSWKAPYSFITSLICFMVACYCMIWLYYNTFVLSNKDVLQMDMVFGKYIMYLFKSRITLEWNNWTRIS